MKLFKRCHHVWRYCRMLNGEEITWHGGKRYVYKCELCGRYEYFYSPQTCEGCRHLFMWNDGEYACDYLYSCIRTNRSVFAPIELKEN